MTFTILQVTSGYSLLRSTIDLYKYVMTAKKLGYQKLALTDEGVLHGAIEFYNLCRSQNIEPIIGCVFQYKQWRNAEVLSPMIVYAKDEISKICICTGSGADLMQDVKADAFLTGDLKYHQALYAKENGLNLIDINHYESERYFSDFLAKYLQNLKIEVIISNSKNPFTYC